MTEPVRPVDLVKRFLEVTASGSLDELADLYAPRFTIEMPFAPPTYPQRVEMDRDQHRAALVASADARRYTRVEDVVIHETSAPEVVVVEYRLFGETLTEPRRPFVMQIAMVMTIRDGVIVHSRDYMNPIVGAQVLGIVPQVVDALQGEGADPLEGAGH